MSQTVIITGTLKNSLGLAQVGMIVKAFRQQNSVEDAVDANAVSASTNSSGQFSITCTYKKHVETDFYKLILPDGSWADVPVTVAGATSTVDLGTLPVDEGYTDITGFVIRNIKPFTQYKAFLSQTGMNNPVVNVLTHTLGIITWARNSCGRHLGTLVGAFPKNKTVLISRTIDDGQDILPQVSLSRVNSDTISLQTFIAPERLSIPLEVYLTEKSNPDIYWVDSFPGHTSVDIRVYPQEVIRNDV